MVRQGTATRTGVPPAWMGLWTCTWGPRLSALIWRSAGGLMAPFGCWARVPVAKCTRSDAHRQQTGSRHRQTTDTTDTPVLKVYTTITLHVWQRVAPSTAVHAQAGPQTLPWNAYFAPVSLGSMESEQDATDKIKQMYHLSVVSQRCHVG